MSDSQGMLSTQQFARQAGISASTISKWLRSGKMKGYKKNGKWLISADQLKRIPSLQDRPLKATPPPDQKKSPAGATANGHYSIEEFSALTYLTPYGIERFIREGRLSATRDASGTWRIDASNLDKAHIRHLVRK